MLGHTLLCAGKINNSNGSFVKPDKTRATDKERVN